MILLEGGCPLLLLLLHFAPVAPGPPGILKPGISIPPSERRAPRGEVTVHGSVSELCQTYHTFLFLSRVFVCIIYILF